jgi:hypothetical protein
VEPNAHGPLYRIGRLLPGITGFGPRDDSLDTVREAIMAYIPLFRAMESCASAIDKYSNFWTMDEMMIVFEELFMMVETSLVHFEPPHKRDIPELIRTIWEKFIMAKARGILPVETLPVLSKMRGLLKTSNRGVERDTVIYVEACIQLVEIICTI